MTLLPALQLIALAGLAYAALASAVASACVPWALARTASWAPERRHRALLLASTAPMIVALVALLAALGPSLLSLLRPEYDHCLTHGGHVHLCLLHPPPHLGNAGSLLALALGVGWLLVRASAAALALRRAARCLERLRSQSTEDASLGASVLPTATPLCALAGVLRPTLLLSSGLLAKLGPSDLPVVLHHERAHAARRDLLLLWIARVGSVFLWPPARSRLLAALHLAAEQSCDEEAASRTGDRLAVAAVILKVERLFQTPAHQLQGLAIAFGGDGVPQRVCSLLAERRRCGSLIGAWLGLALLLGGMLMASAPLHHFTESALGILMH